MTPKYDSCAGAVRTEKRTVGCLTVTNPEPRLGFARPVGWLSRGRKAEMAVWGESADDPC
jgi:hypothetical protein